ncbi:dirigent protein 22-like [Salvia miltiorrhiza]|uniref:dirigent protein 22-like n=1 Tax=Salvia miltiorrhiza TaxID=226208 RepID=UPI0025AD4F9C|nr:dirigent protein 22-like [Salvia miltiorrhiza]
MVMAANVESTIYNVAKFRVYVHENESGPNRNVYEVGRANITASSPTSFGLVSVGDGLMTSGPDVNTGKLGRAQGLGVSSSLTESVKTITGYFVFTEGKYRGSTLIALGRINEEVSVVGGTALFRLARGYANSFTYSNDPRTANSIIVYDFYVNLN